VNGKIGCLAVFCCISFGAFSTHSVRAQAAPAASQPAASAGQDSANDLVVGQGKSVLVDCALPIDRIAIGSADVAEATAVSPTEVMLNGKTPGETSLIIWQRGGTRQFFNVHVRAINAATNDKLDSVRRELRTEFPGQTFRLSSENGQVFLRGTVKDLGSSERAVQIASTAGKVVNLLYVDVPTADPQIMLKVRFASLDRTRSNQLGLNVFSLGAANSIGSVTTQQFSPPIISGGGIGSSNGSGSNGTAGATATLSNLLNLFIFRPDINLGATLQALEARGILEVLAEPNILTANGKQGSLLAGGQYPYPVVQGIGSGSGGAVTIQFKEFGVRLNFIPTITPRNTIRLQVAPEVSSLDFANGISLSGFTVPGLSVRRVKTEVELSEGQSFAIGGLLDNRENETFQKIPFIGDVPILGKLFQSINRTKSNTELVVIVTPEIVAPVPAGGALPEIKYPKSFLPSASGIPMSNPETQSQAKPSPATIPVEKLIQSMQPETPLVIEPAAIGSATGAGVSSGSTQGTQ